LIPEFTDGHLAKFSHCGRPVIGECLGNEISIRVDKNVLKQIKKKAKTMKVGYQILLSK